MESIAELQKEAEARQARATQLAQQQADAQTIAMAEKNAAIGNARLKVATERAQQASS